MTVEPHVRNLLLRQLPPADLARLRSHLSEERMEFKQRLYAQGERIAYLYFPNSGMASVLTELPDGILIETGTIGYEGVTGLPAALVGGTSSNLVFCQVPGSILRLPVAVLRDEQERGGSMLLHSIHRYLHFLVGMLGQTAACNRIHEAEARLARWLLMTQDRIEQNVLPLTQEFLAQMLGVQRPSVNIAVSTLEKAGFITHARGRITVTDREGLETAACDCYRYLQDLLREVFPNALRDGGGATRGD